MKAKRLTLAGVFMSFCLMATIASADPAFREDQTPWFGFGSIVSRILGILENQSETTLELARLERKIQQRFTHELEELTKKKRGAGYIGMPLVADSKSDYQEQIDELRAERNQELADERNSYQQEIETLREEIKEALASPPSDEAGDRLIRIERGTASREAMENYNAMVNLQASILRLNQRLSADRSNYKLAVATYRAQAQLCRFVIEMNQEFRHRIDHVYLPKLEDSMVRIDNALRRMQTDGRESELQKREAEKLAAVKSALRKGKPALEYRKKWAAKNIEIARRHMADFQMLRRNVEIMQDAAGMVAEINSSIAAVDFEIPEMIEYELSLYDFEVANN